MICMSSPGKSKILIVEDDPVTRMLLRRMLSSEPDWEIIEAANGAIGWRSLEECPVDVCITDIQMPELDGVGLLARIRASKTLKSLKVILCTACRDRSIIERVASLAVDHYIVKPFKKELVLARVKEALRAKSVPEPQPPPALVRGDLAGFLRRTGNPPSLPAIYQELGEALRRPDTSISSVSELILRDPALTSRILKLANSALFGGRSDINTVEAAAQLVGLEHINQLVSATTVIQTFDNVPEHLLDVNAFWEHSLVCGLASALIAEFLRDPVPERLFIGGLLHDIGRLIMYVNAPTESKEILQRCERERQLASTVERDILGFDHAEIGGELLATWGLPKPLGECVRRHHPVVKFPFNVLDAMIVHYADFITSALLYGNTGERYVAPLVLPTGPEPLPLRDIPIEPLLNALDSRCDAFLNTLLPNRTQRKDQTKKAPHFGPGAPDSHPDHPRTIKSSLIPFARLEIGMEIGSDVIDEHGGVLLSTGTQITAQHLRELKRYQIQEVAIRDALVGQTEYPPEILEMAEAEVAERFRHVDMTMPNVRAIRCRAVLRTAARLQQPTCANPVAAAPTSEPALVL